MKNETLKTLVIESSGEFNIGRCYHQCNFTIKSLNRPLADSDVRALRDMGWLGYGQEFSFTRGQNEPLQFGNQYYVVNVVTRVDSSD